MTKEEKIKSLLDDIFKHFPKFFGDFTNFEYGTGVNAGRDFKRILNKALKLDKQLKRIEPNNGWIKIEKKSDLPKERMFCWVIDREEGIIGAEFLNNTIEEKNYWLANATHYQPIKKPLKPIY